MGLLAPRKRDVQPSRKGRRRRLDHRSAIGAQLLHNFEEFRVAHAGADIGPAVGLVLDFYELRPLLLTKLLDDGFFQRRHIEVGLLLEAVVEEGAKGEEAFDAGVDLGRRKVFGNLLHHDGVELSVLVLFLPMMKEQRFEQRIKVLVVLHRFLKMALGHPLYHWRQQGDRQRRMRQHVFCDRLRRSDHLAVEEFERLRPRKSLRHEWHREIELLLAADDVFYAPSDAFCAA